MTAATAGEKEVIVVNTPDVNVVGTPGVTIENDSPIPVTIQDGGAYDPVLPFCPCFSMEDIAAAFDDEIPIGCRDDRNKEPGGGTVTYFYFEEGETNLVVSGNEENVYRCRLFPRVAGSPVIRYEDIGFTNAMACRLTIVNSRYWRDCPSISR